jgi:general secretion pathway protein D
VAIALLESAIQSMPENPSTRPVTSELNDQRKTVLLGKAEAAFDAGDLSISRETLSAYQQAGGFSRDAEQLTRKLAAADAPVLPQMEASSPVVTVDTFSATSEVDQRWAVARAAYAAGKWDAAIDAVEAVLAVDPNHRGASRLVDRIAAERVQAAGQIRGATRAQLIEEVGLAWERPAVVSEPTVDGLSDGLGGNPLTQKLASIQIPSVSFSAVELHRVVSTLSDLSREFDNTGAPTKGLNIIVIDPQDRRPVVSLTLRDLSLKRVLDFITDSIGYQYEVQADAIVVRPGGETSTLDTEFFPITRSTVIRMTGIGGGLASGGSAVPNDPFSPAPVNSGSAPGGGSEASALRMFLQQAGVDFEGITGASLAYDGSAMIVTQTSRNVERIRNILNRYNDVRQVEIEAKFMEVQEGALEELGVQWGITHGVRGDPRYLATGQTQNRSVSGAFSPNVGGTNGQIAAAAIPTTDPVTGAVNGILRDAFSVPILNNPPSFPGSVDLGDGAEPIADIQALIGAFDVNAVIRALSRQQGSDLLSAPKVTVLSGNPATITVAQELRYPTSYGEIRSEVGSSSRESSSAGVTITAGTPQDFETRKVGVELRVTPTVEEDDYSISLDLNPKVTEFEGFVEYGGQSVAISNDTTVTVPSGFYQPIFSTREVSTKVTLWDGATLVMGGLTREEVKTVHDKVPFLGSIPGLGRLFRSTGETTQKRNLLIFVTANLVSPGGSPKKQTLQGVPPSSAFQSSRLVTPGGSAKRP